MPGLDGGVAPHPSVPAAAILYIAVPPSLEIEQREVLEEEVGAEANIEHACVVYEYSRVRDEGRRTNEHQQLAASFLPLLVLTQPLSSKLGKTTTGCMVTAESSRHTETALTASKGP